MQNTDGFHALLGGDEQVVVDSDDIVAACHCEMPFEFSPRQVDPSKAFVGGEKSVIALHAKSTHGQFFHRRLLDSGEIHELSVRRSVEIDVAVRVKEHQPSARGGIADVFDALVRQSCAHAIHKGDGILRGVVNEQVLAHQGVNILPRNDAFCPVMIG